ncbi:MAG TPA: transglutaminase-like domain-containing protein [Pseudomonadales bacterium]
MPVGRTLNVYLAPAEYVDSRHPAVRRQAASLTGGCASAAERARALFTFVRELPYTAPDFDDPGSFRASAVLRKGNGYCVAKASLMTALSRAAAIPARLAFADVTNHLATPRTLELMGGNRFAWHGYVELRLGGRWIKVSPTFDSATCARMGVAPLEFDGVHDAHLQPYDAAGRTLMRYERFHGTFHDVPARFLCEEMIRMYPRAHAAIRAGLV